jgi:hypothetical protein
LVQPDRRLSPATHEVKKVYEPVNVEFGQAEHSTGTVQLTISNRYAFRDLSHLRMYWTVLANGRPVQHDKMVALYGALPSLPANPPLATTCSTTRCLPCTVLTPLYHPPATTCITTRCLPGTVLGFFSRGSKMHVKRGGWDHTPIGLKPAYP